jgi:hypothetical protein
MRTCHIEPGTIFGRWMVVGPSERRSSSGAVLWNSICDCGADGLVSGVDLRRGHSRSCGCLNAELVSKRSTTHGGSRHGNSHPLYYTWRGMLNRCTYPGATGYKHWGGRGITVSDRWTGKNGFATFVADMGDKPSPKHTLDRIDNDSGYSPSNVRWSTPTEQAANKTRRYIVPASGQTALVLS